MAAEKTQVTTTLNKSQFIRDHPLTMSAADVIAKAKAEGMTLSKDRVYGVRSQAKRKRKAPKGLGQKMAAPRAGTPKKSSVPANTSRTQKASTTGTKSGTQKSSTTAKKGTTSNAGVAAKRTPGATAGNGRRPSLGASPSSAEDLLRAVAAEIGLALAMEILAGERARVRAVMKQ